MKSTEVLRVLADLTAYQWGMFTSAQASMHGITRLDLSRLAEAGHLERLAHGVYKDAGAPGDQFDDLRAAWLSTDPKRLAHERSKAEIEEYRRTKDPIQVFQAILLAEAVLTAETVEQIDAAARAEAEAAADFADASPYPTVEDIQKDVYWEVDNPSERKSQGRLFFN